MVIDVKNVGPVPLIAALGRELGIVQAINETVQRDEKQCFPDTGTHTLAMFIDILLGRSPFYSKPLLNCLRSLLRSLL